MPRWLLHCLLTLLCFGGWGAVLGAIGDSLPATSCQALSTLGLLPVMLALACSRNLRRGKRSLHGAALAFLAGLVVGLGNIPFFHALAIGGTASAVTSVTALYPLTTVLLAAVLLRERIGGAQLAGISAALASIYFFNVKSPGSLLSPWLLYALIPLVLWGVGALLQKLAADRISSELSTLCFLGAFLPIAAAIWLLVPSGWELSGRLWALTLLLGLLFGLGNLTLIAAYGSGGKASVVTPLCGVYPIVTVPLAVAFLDERVTGFGWAGIVLALAAVVALAIEKR